MQRTNSASNDTMRHVSPMPPSLHTEHNPPITDVLRTSKKQQQHPSTHVHPMKNAVRVNNYGVRHKFDGKDWRLLCTAFDGCECRNMAFRASLCQKHFHKSHLFKRPYRKVDSKVPPASDIPSATYDQSISYCYQSSCYSQPADEHLDSERRHERISDEDDSVEILEHNEFKITKSNSYNKAPKSEVEHPITYFTVDCDSPSEPYMHEFQQETTLPSPRMNRIDSLNHEFDKASSSFSLPKTPESIRVGLPPLTRTEEKSLANELIMRLPTDASLSIAEQIARRRACEMVMDNYSHQLLPMNITGEWFFDFLLRNPRVPIHFQTWFSSVKPTLPSSEQTVDIKIWQLGLVTRSIMPSSSHSTGSSSP